MEDHRTVIPSATRLMASLRDIGYDLPAAIADLVDNSIDAEARNIDIAFARRGADSFIRIADDGIGMTASELDEAMRYGSARKYASGDLGKFGLGLKTASLSQCRRLTVATRTTPRRRIEIRRWDLDRVALHDTWQLERLSPRQCTPDLTEPLVEGVGTVVLWENLDRVLSYQRPDGAAAMAALERASEHVAEHLAMVFHRFLSGEVRHRRPRMWIDVNGETLRAWDPFARSEEATQALASQTVRLTYGARIHRVKVRPFVLPAQIEFSSAEAHAQAAGPARWNRQQGLYIYRGDRMIQSGGWNRLRTMDEHSKLARIAIDLPLDADEAFQINVSKMRVSLPQQIRAELAAIVSGVIGRAQEAYRRRVRLVEGGGREADVDNATDDVEAESWQLGNHWPLIVEVLEEELREHPILLRRTLLALANAQGRAVVPPEGDPIRGSSTRPDCTVIQ